MRFDFILLDEFIRKNPWLTDEERAEILALNDPKRDAISSFDRTTKMNTTAPLFRGRPLLDPVEIQGFFEKYQEIVKSNPNQAPWVRNLWAYISDDLSRDILQKILPLEEFPVLRASLTEDPAANLKLYLDALEGLVHDKSADSVAGAGNIPESPTDTLWLLIDPLYTAPELRVKFHKAMLLARQDLAGPNGSLPPEQFPAWIQRVREYAFGDNSSVAKSDSLSIPDLRRRLDELGIRLSDQKRKELEALFLDDDFNLYNGELGSEKYAAWAPIHERKFARLLIPDELSDTRLLSIEPTEEDYDVIITEAGAEILHVPFPHFVQALGYALVFTQTHSPIMFARVVDEEQMADPVFNKNIVWPYDVEPLGSHAGCSHYFYLSLGLAHHEVVANLPAPKEELTRQPDHFLTLATRLSLIPYLCRNNFAGHLKREESWLEPLVRKTRDPNRQFSQFAAHLSRNLIKYRLISRHMGGSEKEVIHYACLDALKKIEDPRAGLALLLYFAAIDGRFNGLDDYLQETLPALFHNIDYTIVTARSPNNAEMEVTGDRRTLANAWHVWDKKAITLIAHELTLAEPESLKEYLSKLNPEAYQFKFKRHAETSYLSTSRRLAEPSAQISTRVPWKKNHWGEMPIQPLIRRLRLASARDKLSSLDPLKTGYVPTEKLLWLNLTGPERADLKRAFKGAYRFQKGRIRLGKDVNSQSYDFLPAPFLKNLIKKDWYYQNSHRSLLWEALFQTDEEAGLKLFKKVLQGLRRFIARNPEELKRIEEEAKNEWGEKNPVPLESFDDYPSLHDVYAALPFVLASDHPLAARTLEEYRDVFSRANELTKALVEIQSGKRRLIDYELESLSAEFDPSSGLDLYEQISLVQKLSEIMRSHGSSYDLETLTIPWDNPLIISLPPEYRIYLRLTADQLTPEEKSSAPEAISKVLDDLEQAMQKAVILFGDLPQIFTAGAIWPLDDPPDQEAPSLGAGKLLADIIGQLQKRPELMASVPVQEKVESAVALYVRLRPFHSSDPAPFYLQIKNKNLAFNNPYLGMLAFFSGDNSALKRIPEEAFFTRADAGLTFSPEEPIAELLFDLMWEDFTRGVLLFARLQERHGNFQTGQNWFDDACRLALSYRGVNPELPPLEWMDKFQQADSVNLKILDQARPVYEQKIADGSLSKEEKEAWARWFDPEKDFVRTLARLSRYDAMDYPDLPVDSDKTRFTPEEIRRLEGNVRGLYDYLLKRIYFWLGAGLHGYELTLDASALDQEISRILPKEEQRSPWLEYGIHLVLALAGRRESLDELWKYHAGAEKLSSNITLFNEVCQNLLQVGHQVLLYLDTEKYLTGNAPSVTLDENDVMSFVEMGPPDPEIHFLKGHWANHDSNPENQNPPDDHAGMVAQTLLGNYGYSMEPTGMVRNYLLDAKTDELWREFDQTLSQAIADLENGAQMSVVSISLGRTGFLTLGRDFEIFMRSELVHSIQNKMDFLKQKEIPIVIAAGNAGKEGLNDQLAAKLLGLFNIFSILDPSLIIVGSSKLQPPQSAIPHGISAFTSPGGLLARPDLVHLGEGYDFLLSKGGSEDVAGTSFATPATARLIAKMKHVNPHLSVEMIQAILKTTAMDLPDAKPDREGAGQVNPQAALYAAFAVNLLNLRKAKNNFAAELGISSDEQHNLDWLIRRLRRQVLIQDTTRQNFAE